MALRRAQAATRTTRMPGRLVAVLGMAAFVGPVRADDAASGRRLLGVVLEIGEGRLTVETVDHAREAVRTGPATRYETRDGAPAVLADVTKGLRVVVEVTGTSGSYEARRVRLGVVEPLPPEPAEPAGAGGHAHAQPREASGEHAGHGDAGPQPAQGHAHAERTEHGEHTRSMPSLPSTSRTTSRPSTPSTTRRPRKATPRMPVACSSRTCRGWRG